MFLLAKNAEEFKFISDINDLDFTSKTNTGVTNLIILSLAGNYVNFRNLATTVFSSLDIQVNANDDVYWEVQVYKDNVFFDKVSGKGNALYTVFSGDNINNYGIYTFKASSTDYANTNIEIICNAIS